MMSLVFRTFRQIPRRAFFSRPASPKCPSSSPCEATPCQPKPEPPPKTETFEDISSFPEDIRAFKMKQRHFQKDDGLPVHLKGGSTDKMLMQLTFVLCGVGVLGFVKLTADLMMTAMGLKEKPQ